MTSLVVQWLRLCTPNVGGPGSIPGQGIKIPHATTKSSYCCCLVAKSCLTLWDPMDCSLPGSSVHGISQARILEWGCLFLLQGIFLTQGSNPCILHWQADSLPLNHRGTLYWYSSTKRSCSMLQDLVLSK